MGLILAWSFSVADYVAPWIEHQTPVGDNIAPTALIAVDVLDDYSGINLVTLDAYVNGNLAFSGPSSFVSPYTGPLSSIVPTIVDGYDGYHLILDNLVEFVSGEEYIVRIVCSDNYGNALDTSWQFAVVDYIDPWVQDQFPVGENISPNAEISANILDDYSGIDLNTLDAYVNGTLVFSGPSTFYAPFNGTGSTIYPVIIDSYDGYHLVLDNIGEFPSAGLYEVRITCSDHYGNSVESNWSFRAKDYVAPFLRNQDPADDAAGVDPSALISFDILDDYSGVNVDTLDAYVDGTLAFTGPGTFIAPFNGPSSSIVPTIVEGYQGYHVVLDRTVDFDAASMHAVEIVCSDNYGNILGETITTWGFAQWGQNQWGGFILEDIWTFYITNAVQSVTQGPYEITFDVSFYGPMAENAELIAPANYVFNNGAYARKVEVISSDTVRLWTELVYGESTYLVTVSNVTDVYGAPISPGYETAVVSPFISDADFANTNGMVRTWRESLLVHADTYRAYLAGRRGIDVFRKISGATYNRWAQVFDINGVHAMYVANFPGPLNITDSTAPYLCNQLPAQSGFATPNTEIRFTIADDFSAVEIPAVTIYINGNIVFRGSYSGWNNDYNGVIEIDHQDLNVILYPPSDFIIGSLVVVRVVATDLFGHRMDSTYSFTIASPISTGFGISEFGWSPFGGVSL